jgi:hypothetical protein
MIVDWMRVGFVHGVMNTDNMSILGLTIDYGPYGWLENYDPTGRRTPPTRDAPLSIRSAAADRAVEPAKLANAIYPLVGKPVPFEAVLHDFARLHDVVAAMMACSSDCTQSKQLMRNCSPGSARAARRDR